jgi:hypothetical protein
MSYKGVKTYVLNDPVTLLKLGPSSPLKWWSVLGFVPRLEQVTVNSVRTHDTMCFPASYPF